ncbi:SEC-C metal-binding domain-containing protein [Candidatus Neomarinimicrobiota bacterium]
MPMPDVIRSDMAFLDRLHSSFPISLHGTEEGWKLLEEDPKISKVLHEEWVAMLPAAIREIYEFWLPVRRAEAQVSQAAFSQKVSRNESCPCGSGKKYKKCCGAPEPLS